MPAPGAGPDPYADLRAAWAAVMRSSVGAPGAEVVEDPDVLYGTLGVPIAALNTVIGARFGADDADARIGAVLDWFRVRSLPLVWFVNDGDTPADLADRLHRRGFRPSRSMPAMSAELDALPDEAAPPGVVITRVRDHATFDTYCDVMTEGFEAPPELGDAFRSLADLGFADANLQRAYLATLDDRPVATSLGVAAGDVVGIFNVATLPDARGRGIGRAITLAAMRDGAARGARRAVLQSSRMGHPVYERLGFRDVLTYVPWERDEAAPDEAGDDPAGGAPA